MLAGSVDGPWASWWSLLPTPQGPLQINLFGEHLGEYPWDLLVSSSIWKCVPNCVPFCSLVPLVHGPWTMVEGPGVSGPWSLDPCPVPGNAFVMHLDAFGTYSETFVRIRKAFGTHCNAFGTQWTVWERIWNAFRRKGNLFFDERMSHHCRFDYIKSKYPIASSSPPTVELPRIADADHGIV